MACPKASHTVPQWRPPINPVWNAPADDSEPDAIEPAAPPPRPRIIIAPNAEWMFATFAECPGNRIALTIARSVLEAHIASTRLTVWGPTGCGKSHLLHAIANDAGESAALVSAVQVHNLPRLPDTCTLLLVDDIDCISDEGAARLIDIIDDRAIVCTATSMEQVRVFPPRLSSRLIGGMTAEIGALDTAARRCIAEQYVRRHVKSLEIGADAIATVGCLDTSDGRQVHGAINAIVIRATTVGMQQVTSALCEDVLWSYQIGRGQGRYPRIAHIINTVSDHYEIPVNELLSQRRTKRIVLPRQIAMYLAKSLTLRSLPEIGRRMGGKDHTTILHAVRKITALIETNPDIAADIDALKRVLGA